MSDTTVNKSSRVSQKGLRQSSSTKREYAARRYVVSRQKERLHLCWQTAPLAAFDTPGVCAFTALGLITKLRIALGFRACMYVQNFPRVRFHASPIPI